MLLLVDDDPIFLAVAQAQLAINWRGILFARDAKQAKHLMKVTGDTVSLVLIDLVLPGQDGWSLIEEFHAAFPDLPIIAISAFIEGKMLERAKRLGAAEAFEKPITADWQSAIARLEIH